MPSFQWWDSWQLHFSSYVSFLVMLSYQGFQCLFWDFFGVDLLSMILIYLLGFLISFDGLILRELCAINLNFLHKDDCEWGQWLGIIFSTNKHVEKWVYYYYSLWLFLAVSTQVVRFANGLGFLLQKWGYLFGLSLGKMLSLGAVANSLSYWLRLRVTWIF
jgi:hypothetical protein